MSLEQLSLQAGTDGFAPRSRRSYAVKNSSSLQSKRTCLTDVMVYLNIQGRVPYGAFGATPDVWAAVHGTLAAKQSCGRPLTLKIGTVRVNVLKYERASSIAKH